MAVRLTSTPRSRLTSPLRSREARIYARGSPVRTVKNITPASPVRSNEAHPFANQGYCSPHCKQFTFLRRERRAHMRHKNRKWLAIAGGVQPAGDVVRLPGGTA